MKRGIKERLYLRLMKWAQEKYMDSKDDRDTTIPRLTVTDHALLRYLERFEGVDVNRARLSCLGVRFGHNTRTFRDGRHIAGRIMAVVKNKTIITVYPIKEQ